MRWIMTWMMAATLFVAVAALPGCGSTNDGRNEGSGSKTQHQDSGGTGSTNKNDSNKGSGSR